MNGLNINNVMEKIEADTNTLIEKEGNTKDVGKLASFKDLLIKTRLEKSPIKISIKGTAMTVSIKEAILSYDYKKIELKRVIIRAITVYK